MNASVSASNVMLRNAGLLTSGEIDRIRLVGPIEPATKRGRDGSLRGVLVAGRPRQLRALEVQLVDQRLEPVVGLRDRGAAEGVGLDDVAAGLEILAVDVGDDVGPRQHQHVVVAAQIAADDP